ncbi:MAG: glycosyltransferase family 39 protein [Deltaproteobacteria bacterium]|nr:glycosyltransferase family 39 protein [Deltaproteobacteria bacterium]
MTAQEYSLGLFRRHTVVLALTLLVLLGGVMRFYRIGEPGFTEGADCMYTETARALVLLAQWSWENPRLLGGEGTDSVTAFFAEHAALPLVNMPYSCKPLYDLMNALAIAVAGCSDGVLPALSALAGTWSLLAIFALGRELYGERVGLWAVALLAVSGGGLVFSRYGQSHMVSILFFMVGFWFYLRSLKPGLSSLWALSGCSLFFGFALTTHPNLLPYVALFLLYDLLLTFRGTLSWKVLLQRVGVGLGVMVSIGVLLNLPFQLVGYFFRPFFDRMAPQMGWPFMTYFEQLPHHFSLVVTEAAPGLQERAYTYLGVFWAWEGSVVAGLVVGSLACWFWHCKRASTNEIILYSQLVIPLMFWIFSENQAVNRFAAPTLPVALVIAGRELDRIASFFKDKLGCSLNLAAVVLCLLVMGFNAYNNRVVYHAHSAHKGVVAWLRAHGQSSVMVCHPRSFRFYGISPVALSAGNLEQAHYLALYPRYLTEKERRVLPVVSGQSPALKVVDARPGKLLEVEFMKHNLVLKLLQRLPVIGRYVAQMRSVVIENNDQRRLELYDITPLKTQIAAVL